jgi:ribonuclease R
VTERRAMKAERETADRLIAHFLADRVGATFDGHISGVTRAGLFVELDQTGADGFIPARNIGDEYFRFEEARRAFVGRFATHRLGDPVTVELVEAAPVAGALRFRLVGHAGATARDAGQPPRRQPTFAPKPRQKSHGRRRSHQ